MNKRPLLIIALAYAIGITFGNNIFALLIIMLAFCCSLFFFYVKKSAFALVLTLATLASILGILNVNHINTQQNKLFDKSQNNSEINFEAQIVSEPDIKNKKIEYTAILRNNEAYKKTKFIISVFNRDGSATLFESGDIITGYGVLSLPSPARNFGGFDYKSYLKTRSISANIFCSPENVSFKSKAKLNPVLSLSKGIRKKIEESINSSLPPNEAGLLKGILIGDKNGLTEEITNNFTISGLTHIVCVSGANVAYVAFATLFFLGILKIKKPYANSITIFVLIIFNFVTGASASVTRATIMGIMLLLAEIFDRKSDPVTSISGACLLLLVYNPFTILDVSFQLSFAGALGIILLYKKIEKWLSFLPKALNDVVSVSLAAQIAVTPILAFHFNKISLISIIANIPAVPLAGIATILGLISGSVGFINQFISSIVALPNLPVLSIIIWLSELCASIPFAIITVVTPSIIIIIVYYLLIYLLFWYIPTNKPSSLFYKKLGAIIISSALIIFTINSIIPKPMQISFIDVGQGDSCLIKSPSGRTCLIDGGGTYPGSYSSYDAGKTVVSFLLDEGISKIDLIVLSHPHGDHIQGLFSIIETMQVEKVLTGPIPKENSDYKKLLETCKNKKIQVVQVSRDTSINLREINMLVLSPPTEGITSESELNNNSLVIKLVYKNFSILFPGDTEQTAEEELVRSSQDINSDIYKVPHHGSKTSSSKAFIEAISPELSIISVGKNTFGHPSDNVINSLTQIGSKVLRTDLLGCITVKTYGEGFSYETCIDE